MTTNTAGTNARDLQIQATHYLRKRIQYSAGATAVTTIGIIPAGAIVTRAYVCVVTAFNAGTANVMDIGTSLDDDGFATDLALGTIGVISADEFATTNDFYAATDLTLTATLALSGTAATAGDAHVIIEFIPNNDG